MKERKTPSEMFNQWVSSARYAVLPLAMIGGLAVSMTAACGGGDTATNEAKDCLADDDCDLGTVCILTTKKCQAVSCDFCISGQVCYTAEEGAEPACSKPECTSSAQCDGEESCVEGLCIEATCDTRDDCPDGQICNALAGICQNPPDSCTLNTDCPTGLVCQDDGSCVPGCATDLDCEDVKSFCNEDSNLCEPGCRTNASCESDQICNNDTRQCECDQSKCQEGFFCDADVNACVEKQIESCDEVTCGDNQICNPDNGFQCEEKPPECSTIQGDPNACPPGEQCNQATGQCQVMTCPGITQADCDGTDQPVLNLDFCACVQCVDDTNCPTGASCNTNGQCVEGCEACDVNVPGACGDAAPFCFNGCCAECTTNSECQGSDVCLSNNRCGPLPSCADDPTVCPTGTECVAGQCQQMTGGGGSCDPNDVAACPGMEMCTQNPFTMMFECSGGGLGGGGGCGLTGATCMPPTTCDSVGGFLDVCVGCNTDADCAAGTTCQSLLFSPKFCSPL